MDEVYKINLSIELGYSDKIVYTGKDLSMAATLVDIAINATGKAK